MEDMSYVTISSPLVETRGVLMFHYSKWGEVDGTIFSFKDAKYEIQNKDYLGVITFLNEMEVVFCHENETEEWCIHCVNLPPNGECVVRVFRKEEVFPTIKNFLQQDKGKRKRYCSLI